MCRDILHNGGLDWAMEYFTNVLATFLDLGRIRKDPCCLWEGQRALGFDQKYPNLCSEDQRRSYGFGMVWGWVINVNYPFKAKV